MLTHDIPIEGELQNNGFDRIYMYSNIIQCNIKFPLPYEHIKFLHFRLSVFVICYGISAIYTSCGDVRIKRRQIYLQISTARYLPTSNCA